MSRTQINSLDPETQYDAYWLDQTIVDVMKLFNFKHQDTSTTSEDDLSQSVWDFVSSCYSDLGFQPCGGEAFSRCTSEMLNKKRKLDGQVKASKQCFGLKPDTLFKKNDVELGAIEFKMKDKGENGTEELREKGFKCPFVLKCMLDDMVNRNKDLKHNLTTSGYFIADHKITPIIMDQPFENIAHISRQDSLFFPRALDKEFAAKSMKVFIIVFKMKLLMKETLDRICESDNNLVFD